MPGASAKGERPLAGVLTVVVRGGDDAMEATLGAGDYEAVPLADSGKGDARRQFFQLFKRDTSKLTPEEREQYAASYKSLLAARRKRTKDSNATLDVSAFLHRNRREAAEVEYDSPASKDSGQISTRLVTSRGRAVSERLVYLFGYDPQSRLVRVVGTDRSDEDGTVAFRNIPSGSYYRIETAPNAETVARSGVIRLDASETVAPRTMVLVPPDRTASGLVLWKGEPAAGVTVRTIGPNQPTLHTTTDAHGFYQFGPLRAGEVVLSLSRSDIHDGAPRFWRTETGTEEPVVPLDLLDASPTPR